MNTGIKIFVSHHKAGRYFNSGIVSPIQVGAAKSNFDLNILRDDAGENISYKNDKYCELTAQYWVWKNVDAEYYGFMHYRRHFVFNNIPEIPDDGGLLHFLELDDEYIKKIGLNDEQIEKVVDGQDIILPPLVDLSGWCAPSNEIQYSCLSNLHAKDFDMVCNTVIELYPEYSSAVERFRKGHDVYWYNMFIMRKDIFKDYSEWLFNILETAERNVCFSDYDAQEKRTLAFMAERLLTIYILKQEESNPETRIKHLKITFLHHTDILPYDAAIKAQDKSEPEKDFIELLQESLQRSCSELYAINRLPATNECDMEDSIQFKYKLTNSHLILYGAGNFGRRIKDTLEFMNIESPIEIWDAGKSGNKLDGVDVIAPRFGETDYTDRICIITIADKGISEMIKNKFIDAGANCVITKDEFMRMALNSIWQEMCKEYL